MNIISHLFSEINHQGAFSEIKNAAFQPGQIVNGKIIKLFPNGIASLQVGSNKVIAQLEASLEAQKSYWFQVQPGEGKVRLKVLTSAREHGQSSADSVSPLLKKLLIPITAEHMKMTHFLLKEQLPINKNMIEQGALWLKDVNSNQAGLEAIKQLVARRLPITKSTFQAILATMDVESLTDNLLALGPLLQKNSSSSSAVPLAKFVQQLMQSDNGLDSALDVKAVQQTGEAQATHQQSSIFVEMLKDMVNRLGYTYEHEIGKIVQGLSHENGTLDTLKPLLLNFIKEEPVGAVRNHAETILHKITGFQLLSQNLTPIEQFALQIPLPFRNKTIDLTMQWSGRKHENGQIDPAYCRILFYLELEHLLETMVDMQVQNRIITLTIVNEHNHIKQLAEPYMNILKGNLQALHFTLSSVHFVKPSEQKLKQEMKTLSPYNSQPYYSGVDLRI